MINFSNLAWFLKRPRLYREMLRVASRKIHRLGTDIESTTRTRRELSQMRCRELAVSSAAALEAITGHKPELSFQDAHPREFQLALQCEREVPIQMGGAADIDLLYHLAEHIQARHVLETGVAYGWSSLALLLSLRKRTDTTLVSTDMPYIGRQNDPFVGCVVPESLRTGWCLINLPDREAIPKALRLLPELDLCHYDSDKSEDGRRWAYPRLWDALRPGGLFLSDDIGDNLAFLEFASKLQIRPLIVASDYGGKPKYVGILQKPGPSQKDSE